MSEPDSSPIPPGWGQDPLTQYLDYTRQNHLATFANKRSEVIDLIAIDGMFRKLLDNARNPKPFFPSGFLLRAHSAYLSAVGAVMAGQTYEAQALLRLCLEQGAYAHYIGDDRARYERWMSRHVSPEAKAALLNEFTHRKILRHIAAADPKLGDSYKKLYERTIDYGAHPNVHGMLSRTELTESVDGDVQFLTSYLQAEGLSFDFGLRTVVQVGLWVLRAAKAIYPARMQAAGVQFQLEDMCKRF